MQTPVIGFSAWSGAGKTTLIEKLLPLLKARGLRISLVKHDGHGFEMDSPGTDTFRFTRAGADSVLITSPAGSALLDRELSLEECLSRIHGADLILVEGFRFASIPRIGICRKAAGKDFTEPLDRYIAAVCDTDLPGAPVPVFSPEDAEGLTNFIIREMNRMSRKDFSHFNDQGQARMVDVGEKSPTHRTALAAGRVLVNRETFDLIRSGGVKKGDVLTVAQVAGIMAAKHTPDWIPMCHPIPLSGADLSLRLDEKRLSVEIEARAECDGRTGVEMEALTAVSCAALTVYDMCKAVQRDMVISDIRLLRKTGGIHGDFNREDRENE